MPSNATTLVWLAPSEARGHLMRAHLVSTALAPRGVRVRVLTTTPEGAAFLHALGTPARVLPGGCALAFDARQNLDPVRTRDAMLRYLASTSGAARDLRALSRACTDADLLVNDFHPLPLLHPGCAGVPVVHVYGTHLWESVERFLSGRGPAAMDRGFGALTRALRARAYARVEHTLTGHASSTDAIALRPVVCPPTHSASTVRARLGVSPDARLAAVYLNPHFRDPALATAIEATLRAHDVHAHCIGEGYAARPGWRAYDPAFNDVAAAANVLISAPGMGALSAWSHFGTPLLALVTDQPEQRANLRYLAQPGAPSAVVQAAASDAFPSEFRASLDTALGSLLAARSTPATDPARSAQRSLDAWAHVFDDLARAARVHRLAA